MILVRFIMNLATGVLTALGAVLFVAAVLAGLLGLISLLGIATLAAVPGAGGGLPGMEGHVIAGMASLCVFATAAFSAVAGWYISQWIYSCWQKASNRTTT